MRQDPFDDDDGAPLEEALATESKTDEVKYKERKARVPAHMRKFYANSKLGEKGVWEKTQPAVAMRAYLMKDQLVTPRSFGHIINEKFGRLDAKRETAKLVKEGGQKVVPRQVRRFAGVILPADVDRLLGQMPDEVKSTPERLTAAIGQVFGIRIPENITRRANRAKKWVLRNPERRMPMHIREGVLLSTAVLLAGLKLFPERLPDDVARELNKKYGLGDGHIPAGVSPATA